MIRLAFVIPTLDQSGAERQLALLAAGLPRDRFDVRVFALNRGGCYADQLREDGIPVEILGKRFRFDPLTYVRLRAGLRRFQPAIVQSFLFAANSYVRLPGICPRNSRVIISERCVDTWKSGWQLKLDRLLIPRAAAVTANSESVAAFYESVGVPRPMMAVIPNGVPRAEAVRDRSYLRRELGLADDDRIVGFVGRLAGQKRLEDLTWAFQLLHQVVDRAKLVLIGEGPERDALAELAVNLGCRDKIIFAGHRRDAYKLMQGLDAFCLPSAFEGASNSLMEAMSLGLPVVVSDIAPNRELVHHEQNGLVFRLGDAPQITRSLKRLLEQPELANVLGSAAQQFVIEHHSVQRMIENHLRLYTQLQADAAD